jgi:hypothetical protein
VSDYGLDDRAIGVRSPARAKDFSSILCVQTGSGGPPSLLYNGYRGDLSTGVKRGRGVTLTAHLHVVPRSRMSRSCTSSRPKRLHSVKRDFFFYFTVTFALPSGLKLFHSGTGWRGFEVIALNKCFH